MIANRRQISIVSLEDCQEISKRMGIEAIKPEWLGANILVRGIEKLAELPVATRLIFPDGTGLICEGENLPCIGPGKIIERMYKQKGLQSQFVPSAHKLRGIVCSVEREGVIHKGDSCKLF